ncbi:hypothetical protein [Ferrimonas marina]|nr:hypothetical protein [Ferrimonas marina]
MLLLAVVMIPVLAWNGVLSPDEQIATWFQRSGSLVVLCAALIEYILFKISLSNTPASGDAEPTGYQRKASPLYLRVIHGIKYLAAGVAIIGTVIWGYGDLIYSHITAIGH